MSLTEGDDLGRLVPLLSSASRRMWKRLLEHPDAPRWNARVGDRVIAADLVAVDALRARLAAARAAARAEDTAALSSVPQDEVLAIVARALRTVPLLRDRAPAGVEPASDPSDNWQRVPFTSREDLATRPELLVPDDADLSRVIVHSTSGTSGHAVVIPMSPRSLALSHALLEDVLAAHGVRFTPSPESVAVTHLCAQRDTFVFATVFSVWGGAPFVRENLDDGAWPGGRDAARRFARAWPSAVVSGDPAAFRTALEWELPIAPRAFVSTAHTLEPALAARLESVYGARVIDWYSLTETGPIAASVPGVDGLVVIAPDLFVEALGPHGVPVSGGERGELTVSGGRNPYFPLVRYRTGDTGRIVRTRRADGSVRTRILELEGRRPVVFRDAARRPLPSVDLTRALRAAATLAQHAIHQQADGSIDVRLRGVPGISVDTASCADALRALVGVTVRATVDETLGQDGKLTAYRSDA